MIINQLTELMKNQKYAQALLPDTMFKALPTQEGSSLFFSIGPDNAFYISREVQADSLGWSRVNLSAQFADTYKGSTITIRTFDVAQDIINNYISIAIVVTVTDKTGVSQDYLYVSYNNQNSDANWETANPLFTWFKFDDQPNIGFAGLPITDVFISQIDKTKFIIADILTDTTTNFVSRYYVDVTMSKITSNIAWHPHTLAGNLEAGTITSVIGRKGGEGIDGIYTLGAIGHEAELLYTPSYDNHVKGRIPSSISIALPDGATTANTAFAVARTTDPYTDLFIVANGSLYYLDYSSQVNLAIPTKVYTHALLNGVTVLHVNQWNGQLVLWGFCKDPADGVQKVFVMECQAGSETVDSTYDITGTGTGWKCPIPLLFDVLNVSTFINNQLSASVIFAHLNVDEQGTLVQLSEDPATSAWHQRSILIPEVVITNTYDVNTYSTHLEFTDANYAPQPGIPVSITSTAPCSVYVNDVYYTLDTVNPRQVNTDSSGVVTIVQEVDSIGAVSYFVTAGDQQNISVNPLAVTISKFSGFNDENNIDITKLNVNVTDETGKTTPLVGSDVKDDQKTLAVSGITQFVLANNNVKQDGSIPPDPVSATALKAANVKFNPAKDHISGVSLIKGRAGHYVGLEAMKKMGVVLQHDGTLAMTLSDGSLGSFLGSIESKAGHVLKWMKKEAHKITDVVKTVIGDVVHFYMTIAGDMYHFVVKCMRDIADGIHAMISAVETAFEDVVKWIGMIFNFQDIKNTHLVLNKIFSIFIDHISSDVDGLQQQCQDVFSTLKDDVSNLVGLPATMTDSYGGSMGSTTPAPGAKSPSANWGNHHLKSNAGSSTGDITPENDNTDPTNGLLDQLSADLATSEANFEATLDQLKWLAANASSMSVADIVTKAIGIILNLLIDGTETLVSFAITVIQAIIDSVKVSLETPLDIPVISYLYKKAVGDDLTALGLGTFLAAIPATVIMKVATSTAPFPQDDPTTQQLLNATTMADLQAVFNPPASASAAGLLGGYHVDIGTAMQRATLAMNVCALTGATVATVVLFMTADNKLAPTGSAGARITLINSAGYFLYAAPDVFSLITGTTSTWDVKVNNFCTTAACLKAIADASTVKWPAPDPVPGKLSPADFYSLNISPVLDCLFNFIWLAPPIGVIIERSLAKKTNINDIISCFGNIVFDLSGMAAVGLMVARKNADPDTRDLLIGAAVGVIGGFNMLWGAASVVTSFDGLAQPGA